MTRVLPLRATYEACYADFHWQIPERFNIAAAVCDRHAAAKPRLEKTDREVAQIQLFVDAGAVDFAQGIIERFSQRCILFAHRNRHARAEM